MLDSLSPFKNDDLTGINTPELAKVDHWLNSKPLKLKDLGAEGKVVLLDFWTYSAVTCLRTLPYLKHWDEKYRNLGLVIIGIHTPEFEFEKNLHNVSSFIQEEKIKYSVVLDNDYQIWNLFANHISPRKLLIDHFGRIRHDQAGEGGYAETERQIQGLLKEVNPKLQFERVVPEMEHFGGGAVCYPSTPKTYCGYKRGILGNPEGYFPNRKFEYRYRGEYDDGKIYLEGTWIADHESLKHNLISKKHEDFLTLRFYGLELNAVMGNSLGKKEEVVVVLDEQKVPEDARGKDLIEKKEATIVVVDEPKMYNLIRTNKYGSYVIKLSSKSSNFEIYAFTFGGCLH